MSNSDATIAAGTRSTMAERTSWSGSALLPLERGRGAWLAVSACVLAFAYVPLVWMFFEQQWEKPHYQFFPFVIGAFAWLLWTRWQQSRPIVGPSSNHYVSILLLQLSAAGLLLFALAIRSPWLAMISLILLVAAWFLKISENRQITNLWGIWLLLWLVVPPPRNLDQTLITRLQFVSSQLSSYVLDSLNIDHLMDGNTLSLNSKQLFVDEACSGIISMLSIAACAVIFCVVKNRTPLHMLLLALASIIWATLINVIRISLIAFALEKWGIDWSAGTPHEMLSLVLFLFAFLALICSDQILIACLQPIAAAWNESHGGNIRFGRRLVSLWDWLVSVGQTVPELRDEDSATSEEPAALAVAPRRSHRRWFAATIFAPIAVLQSTLLVYAFERSADRLPAVKNALQFTAQNMPQTFCGLRRTDFKGQQRSANNIQGKYSRTYIYSGDDGETYLLSLDFPFPGFWHELTECYVAAGWQPLQRDVVSPEAKADSGRPWQFVEARFEKPSGERGSLCFSEFDQFGIPYEPQGDWVNESYGFWSSRNLYLKERKVFQVQVWSEGATEWTPKQQETAHQLLLEARAKIRAEIIESSRPTDLPAGEPTPTSTETKESTGGSAPATSEHESNVPRATATEGK